MNKKGIILSIYIYVLLIFFLLVLSSLLVVLSNTKKLSQKIKDGADNIVNSSEYGFSIDLEGPEKVCVEFGEAYVEPGFSATDDNGNSLGVTVDSNLDIWKTGEYEIKYVSRYNNKEKTIIREVIVYKPDLTYTGSYQTFTVPCSGIYNLETWGAEGGGLEGKGAYSKGEIYLEEGTNLYVFVGRAGVEGTYGNNTTSTVGQGGSASYNGGGAGGNAGGSAGIYANYRGGASGGGATDIRLSITAIGTWNNVASLRSRIMVAGGGGGTSNNASFDFEKSSAGTLNGQWGGLYSDIPLSYVYKRGIGGTQISGNSLGVGGTGSVSGYASGCPGHSGGGGGYYGGTGGQSTSYDCYIIGGGGGSSYVSGCEGCNAITINGVASNQPIHYSGYKFDNIVMIDGNEVMPSPSGSTETGHSGNGYARITYIGTSEEVDDSEYIMKKFIAVPRVSGVNIKAISPDNATSTMIRYKTTAWTISDTTSTGTLLSSSFGTYNADDTWYTHTSGLTNGTTYYYKAFPYVNGSYRYLYKQNEVTVTAGGLYAEYLFNDNANDTSGNAYNPTANANITYGTGNIGITSKFNGASSYSAITPVIQTGTVSYSTWIYMNSAYNGTDCTIAAIYEDGGYGIYQPANTSQYALLIKFGGAYMDIRGPLLQTGKWVHVVVVINFTSKYVKMYHNGALYSYTQSNVTYTPTTLTGSDLITCIGCNPGGGATRANYFNGSINQFRIYNRELSKDEVMSLYLEG